MAFQDTSSLPKESILIRELVELDRKISKENFQVEINKDRQSDDVSEAFKLDDAI